MITYEQARSQVARYLADELALDDVLVLDAEVRELPFGWVFTRRQLLFVAATRLMAWLEMLRYWSIKEPA